MRTRKLLKNHDISGSARMRMRTTKRAGMRGGGAAWPSFAPPSTPASLFSAVTIFRKSVGTPNSLSIARPYESAKERDRLCAETRNRIPANCTITIIDYVSAPGKKSVGKMVTLHNPRCAPRARTAPPQECRVKSAAELRALSARRRWRRPRERTHTPQRRACTYTIVDEHVRTRRRMRASLPPRYCVTPPRCSPAVRLSLSLSISILSPGQGLRTINIQRHSKCK